MEIVPKRKVDKLTDWHLTFMHAIYPCLKDRETVNEKMKAIEEVITKALGMKKGSINIGI